MLTHRTLVFPVEPKDSRLTWIQQEFRLLVNKSIRMALQGDIRSRARLNRVGYAILSRDHAVYKQYIPSCSLRIRYHHKHTESGPGSFQNGRAWDRSIGTDDVGT